LLTFFYTAKSNSGEIKTGTQEANSEAELAETLREQGFILTSIKAAGQSAKASSRFLSFLPSFAGASLAEKMMFTRHLAVMIGAGLSLNRALEVLAQQTKNKGFAKVIINVNESVRAGIPLADSLSHHPRCFSELFINMIKVGETSGGLESSLKILAHQMEKQYELKSKVKNAMIYPAVIITAMLGIGILMMVMVVPKLTQIFKEMQTDLPLSTRVIIATSDFLNQHLLLGAFVLIALIIVIRFILKTAKGKIAMDGLILRLPIFGEISRKINSAQLARTLGSLIEGGIPIVQGLQIVANTMSNYLFQDSLQKSSLTVQKGEKLSQAIKTFSYLYPSMVPQMIEVGEETGTMGEILLRLADFYEEEVNDVTKNMASIIEPILMVTLGTVVGFFAIAMLQPMYSLMEGM